MIHRICITVESADRERFQAAADRDGQSLSEWLRAAAEARWEGRRARDDRSSVSRDIWRRMLGASHEREPPWNGNDPSGNPEAASEG